MRAYSREKECDTGRKAILMRSVSEKQWLQRQVRCGDQRERVWTCEYCNWQVHERLQVREPEGDH